MKYQTKTAIVEAIQFTGNNVDELKADPTLKDVAWRIISRILHIQEANGDTGVAYPGDYVVKRGEAVSCYSKEYFEEYFEAVKE